jgi:hypothetical protein
VTLSVAVERMSSELEPTPGSTGTGSITTWPVLPV